MLKLIANHRLGLIMILVIVFCASCAEGPPDFQRGIRFLSFFDVVDTPPANPVHLMSIPPNAITVSGVLNFGDMRSPLGPPSPASGSDPDFAGETDKFGVSDHKDIRDNAVWDIQANYSGAIPGCGVKLQDFNIPQGGAHIYAVCYIKG
ncbi:MAG TPA: hypothetical protein VIF64_08280 [Pyrinomonadaceae bacterium]|jgi:hypothetical protein